MRTSGSSCGWMVGDQAFTFVDFAGEPVSSGFRWDIVDWPVVDFEIFPLFTLCFFDFFFLAGCCYVTCTVSK